jgi:hypothetical protein
MLIKYLKDKHAYQVRMRLFNQKERDIGIYALSLRSKHLTRQLYFEKKYVPFAKVTTRWSCDVPFWGRSIFASWEARGL